VANSDSSILLVLHAETYDAVLRKFHTRQRQLNLARSLLAELPLSAFFPCLTGAIMYKLCALNPAKNRLRNFLAILTVESIASSSLGLAVGSFAPSVDAAIAIAPAVMVIFIVFGGLYVVNAPSYLSWVAQVRNNIPLYTNF